MRGEIQWFVPVAVGFPPVTPGDFAAEPSGSTDPLWTLYGMVAKMPSHGEHIGACRRVESHAPHNLARKKTLRHALAYGQVAVDYDAAFRFDIVVVGHIASHIDAGGRIFDVVHSIDDLAFSENAISAT